MASLFFIFVLISFVGIGVVIVILKKDSKSQDVALTAFPDDGFTSNPPEDSSSAQSKPFSFFKNKENGSPSELESISIKEVLNQVKNKDAAITQGYSAQKTQEPTGTVNIKTSNGSLGEDKKLSKEEVVSIEREIEISTKFDELKDKHDRLEKLFTEKSYALVKVQAGLDNELKNRKEFNKVKDILEKELSECKEKLRKAQAEATTSKAEVDSFKKHMGVLEDKTARLEKEIIAKEHEIDNLVKRLQVFASPATAQVPPKKDELILKSGPEELMVAEPEKSVLEQVVEPKKADVEIGHELKIDEVKDSKPEENKLLVVEEQLLVSLRPDVMTSLEPPKVDIAEPILESPKAEQLPVEKDIKADAPIQLEQKEQEPPLGNTNLNT